MPRRVILAASVLILAVAALAVQAAGGVQARSSQKPQTAAGPIMGPMKMISLDAFVGYYDGKKYTYLSTDTSSKTQAAAWHINYSSQLGTVKGAPPIYLVQGRAAAGQLAAFGSVIGDPGYSPLWEEMIVKWKAGAKPILLTSDTAIETQQKKGKLTVTDSHIVLNCPMLKGK
jgi:hypothetical protein